MVVQLLILSAEFAVRETLANKINEYWRLDGDIQQPNNHLPARLSMPLGSFSARARSVKMRNLSGPPSKALAGDGQISSG